MSTITQKGQVTIPKVIRDELDMHQGDEIIFEMKDDFVVIQKRNRLDVFKKYIGYLSNHKQKTDEIMDELREGS